MLRPPGQVTAAAGGLGRQPVLSQEEDVGWESSPEVHKPPSCKLVLQPLAGPPHPSSLGHPAPRPGAWRLSLPSCYPGLPSPGPAPRPPGGPTWPSSCSPQPCPVSTKGLGSRRWWGARQPRRMEPSQRTRTSHAGSLRPSVLPWCLQRALCPSPWWLRPHP